MKYMIDVIYDLNEAGETFEADQWGIEDGLISIKLSETKWVHIPTDKIVRIEVECNDV